MSRQTNWSNLLRGIKITEHTNVCIINDDFTIISQNLSKKISIAKIHYVSSLACLERHNLGAFDILINLSFGCEKNLKVFSDFAFRHLTKNGFAVVKVLLSTINNYNREYYTKKWVSEIGYNVRIDGVMLAEEQFVFARVARINPTAYLFIQNSGEGKTSAAIELSFGNIGVVHGDEIFLLIARGDIPSSKELFDVALEGYKSENWSISICMIFDKNLVLDFLGSIDFFKKRVSMIFDMFIPDIHRVSFLNLFVNQGYRVVVCEHFSKNVAAT